MCIVGRLKPQLNEFKKKTAHLFFAEIGLSLQKTGYRFKEKAGRKLRRKVVDSGLDLQRRNRTLSRVTHVGRLSRTDSNVKIQN